MNDEQERYERAWHERRDADRRAMLATATTSQGAPASGPRRIRIVIEGETELPLAELRAQVGVSYAEIGTGQAAIVARVEGIVDTPEEVDAIPTDGVLILSTTIEEVKP